MNQPLVSVIAINYNNAPWVIETLDSIAAQTYSNIELIVVDDCSTDNSPDFIEEWLKTYNRPYKFIKHEENQGICKTCNSGLKLSTGTYISMIATDDIMMPEKLMIQVELLEKLDNRYGVVFSDAYLINEDSSPRYGWFIQKHRSNLKKIPQGDIYDILCEGNFIPVMTLLYKKTCLEEIGRFDESLIYEDYDMLLRLAKKYYFFYSDYVSVKYRVKNNGFSLIMHTKENNKKFTKTTIAIYLKNIENKKIKANLINLFKNLYNHDRDVILMFKNINILEIKKIYSVYILPIPNRLKLIIVKYLFKY